MIPDGHVLPLEFFFTNKYGERWLLRVDPKAETGELTGDELGDSTIQIADDQIQSDLMLGTDEAAWLAECWQTATGRQLRTNPFQQLLSLLSQLSDENGEG